MADLFDSSERAALSARLQRLRPDDEARWGSLTPARLLAHLIDAFAIGFGERKVQVRRGFLSTRLGRALVLRLPIPRGRITAPPDFHATEPGDFAADKQRVLDLIARFADGPDQRWGSSPIFGELTPRQWATLQAKHLRHHLEQFGL